VDYWRYTYQQRKRMKKQSKVIILLASLGLSLVLTGLVRNKLSGDAKTQIKRVWFKRNLFEGGNGQFKVEFGQSSRPQLNTVKIEKLNPGEVISFSFKEQAMKSPTLEKNGDGPDKVTQEINEALGLDYSILEDQGVKEKIVLKEKPKSHIFTFELETNGLRAEKIKNEYYFFNEEGVQFRMAKPFMIDAHGVKSEAVKLDIPRPDLLQVIADPEWLAAPSRTYPVVIDPTVTLIILDVYSHPKEGEEWRVSFFTSGEADLAITPADQQTIDDLDFVFLKCGEETRTPQILDGDVLFFPDWQCPEAGQVSHLVLQENKHELIFQFDDQIASAHNWSDLGGGDHGGADWIITTDTNIAGEHTNIGAFGIDEGITATVQPYSGGSYGSVTIEAQSATVSGTLAGNSSGYGSSEGTGQGTDGNFSHGGGGAGYGGLGGDGQSGRSGGSIYGSVTAPTDMGSGGGQGRSVAPGGSGGGYLRLDVTGTATVSGSITANGGNGTKWSGDCAGGGGSGGGIYITTGTWDGDGSITANGGNGGNNTSADGGGGAGGRIAIYYDTNNYTGSLSATGGSGPGGAEDGAAGTIYQKDSGETYGDLTIDNTGRNQETYTELSDGSYNFKNMTVTNYGFFFFSSGDTVSIDNLTIQNNGWLNTEGSVTVNTSLTISSGTLTLSAGTFTLPSSYTLDLEGTFEITGGTLNNLVGLNVQDGGTFTLNNSSQTITLTTFTLVSGGTVNLIAGTFTLPSSTTLDLGGTFEITGGTLNNLVGLNVQDGGTFTLNNSSQTITLTTFTLVSGGTVNLTDGTLSTPSLTCGGDFNHDGGTLSSTDIIISGTYTLNTSLTVQNDLTIQSGGTMTHSQQDTDFDLTVNHNLDIQSGGSINVDEKGYGPSSGPGEGGDGSQLGGGGAGYGGAGGESQGGAEGGSVYGEIKTPTYLGSGGGNSTGGYGQAGGAGGGMIKLNVSGTATISGTISTTGQDPGCGLNHWYGGGGGSGGSVYIITDIWDGNGSISANGGDGGSCTSRDGGGGGGGRIAVYYTTTKTYTGTLSANGGDGPGGAEDGEEGTIYQQLLSDLRLEGLKIEGIVFE
jgi:hypothetical protein